VKIGRPIKTGEAKVGDHAVYRRIIDEVMYEIQGLCGQEYVNTYAGAKEAPDAAPSIPRRSSASVLVPRPLVSTN